MFTLCPKMECSLGQNDGQKIRMAYHIMDNGIDIGNCSVQQCYNGKIKLCQTNIIWSVLKVSKSQKENTKSKKL